MSVGIERGGLRIAREDGNERSPLQPLLVASVHYWRIAPSSWRAALLAVKELGFRYVDTYVPWSVHEQSDGTFDFGRGNARLDVALFLRIAHELELGAIVRPGPHINAELSTFGIPERVLWDEDCQARGPTGSPVVLPFVPRMFPVPSYVSDAFHAEVRRYFEALVPVLAPLCAPEGPIAMVQIDNEGAFYFRDGAYDQDYHPDAIAKYRAFLTERYEDDEALRRAYPAAKSSDGKPLTSTNAFPPTSGSMDTQTALAHHLDWTAFQEHMLAEALGRFADALREAGLPPLPTSHNFPLAQDATPLNAALVGAHVDVIGLDYYNRARPIDRAMTSRRTSELALRCDATQRPAYAPEMGAGFPPYFPPLSDGDSRFTLLTALAYGLRGFNLYMAVERDRWIGAPIDRRGRPRPNAEFYRLLTGTLERVGWWDLHRRVPVRIVVPRTERRLARVLHAFGPVSGALLGVSGLGPREGCIEIDAAFGGASPLSVSPVDTDTLLRAFEQALDARGVPHAVIGGEEPDVAVDGAEWLIVLTSGAVEAPLGEALARAQERGVPITVGPGVPELDEAMRPHAHPWGLEAERLSNTDPRSVDAVVAAHLEKLSVPAFACDPDGVYATVHETAEGEPAVAFVINTKDEDLVARVTIGEERWEDAMSGESYPSERGVVEIRMRPRAVRILASGHPISVPGR